MKVYIKTYGCQMNERDSDAMASQLESEGHTIVFTEEEADALIFNTCSVRDAAERKAKGKIGYMKKLKDRKPGLIIGVAGCMAQRLGDELLKELPHLDFVLGTGQLHTLPEQLQKVRQQQLRFSETAPSPDVLTGMSGHFSHTWHAEIAITRGCNRFCSYCIVPYVRGREISRSMESVIDEAKKLADSGVKEILLLGQNVAAYGMGDVLPPIPDDESPFADLLERISAIEGIRRIRFTSPHPAFFNKKLIEMIARLPKVCKNIHLPMQSGSDRILKEMNRPYNSAQYYKIVEDLRSLVPHINFSTDIIVGFPTETEEDFNATHALMHKVGFDNAFIFKYSPRKGTKSAKMTDDVPQAEKERRNQVLLAELEETNKRKNAALVGETFELLVEGPSKRNSERWSGRTDTFKTVVFPKPENVKEGDFIHVKITSATSMTLYGEVVEK